MYRWHGAGGKEAKLTWDSHSNAVCTQEVVLSHLHMPMYSVSLRVLPTSTSRLEGEIIFILVTCSNMTHHRHNVVKSVDIRTDTRMVPKSDVNRVVVHAASRPSATHRVLG